MGLHGFYFTLKAVNKLPAHTCADLDVTFALGHKNRVIVRYNPNCTDCFDVLFNALLFRKSSTVYQIFKELLDDIALLCQRTERSNRDIVKLKDLPTLVWQIVNRPTTSAKIA